MPDDFRQVLACVQVAIKGVTGGGTSEMVNVIHFQTGGAQPSQGDVDAVIALVSSWCSTTYKQNFTNSVTITELRAKSLYASSAPFALASVAFDGTQNDADELAHAPLFLLRGPLSDRHQAGKFYAFPPGGAMPQTGYPPAYLVNMKGALDALRLSANFAGYALAVASRDMGVAHAVKSIGYSNRLTFQKRRRLGFGR